MCEGLFLGVIPCSLLDLESIWGLGITLFLSLILHYILQHRYKAELDKEIERYKQNLNEQSEVFRHKLELLQSFFTQEYLPKKRDYSDDEISKSLNYYGKIGLLGKTDTLKAIANSKLSEEEPPETDISQIYDLICSLRRELNPTVENDKKVLFNYSKVLIQIFTPKPNKEIISDSSTTNTQNPKSDIGSSNISFMGFDKFISFKKGKSLKDLEEGNGFEYIRIGDIIGYEKTQGKYYKINAQVSTYNLKNTLLVSVIGTIGKIGFIEKKQNVAISGTIAYGELDVVNINPKYFEIIRNTKYIQSQIELYTSGSAQKFLALYALKSLTIPIIPLQDQEVLVNKATSLDSKEKIIKELDSILPRFVTAEQAFLEKVIDLLSQHPQVSNIVNGFISIPGLRGFYPDLLVELNNGKKVLVELKHTDYFNFKEIKDLEVKLQNISNKIGYEFILIGNHNIGNLGKLLDAFCNNCSN